MSRAPNKPFVGPLPKMPPLVCPDCDGEMRLRNSRFGLFYGCVNWPKCECNHGAHQATGEPLGVPANKATRAARIRAHDAFDVLWMEKKMSRTKAYEWLAREMQRTEVHIGEMSIEDCDRVVTLCEQREEVRA